MQLFSLLFWFDAVMQKLLTVTATVYIPSLHKYTSIPFWFSGDGKNYTTSFSKKTYLNGKLDEGEAYMVFQRGYLNVCFSLLFFLTICSNPFMFFFIFFSFRTLMLILEFQFKTSVLITLIMSESGNPWTKRTYIN